MSIMWPNVFKIAFGWVCCLCSFYVNTNFVRYGHPDVTEYCQWETFNATCDQDDVILMLTARYGRMRFGRCMREDHGSVGCSADVLAHMDRKCSGRRTCQVTIPDATLHSIQQCPKEIMPYLEASFTCVSLKLGNRHTCNLFGGQPLRTDTGYLQPSASSLPSLEKTTYPGTLSCPWLIQMRPGQRINFTLFNFHLAPEISPGSDPISGSSRCSGMRVLIQDKNRTIELGLCGERQREKHMYLSEGHSVSLHIQHGHSKMIQETATSNTGMFLIKYQVVGCPDIGELTNAWVIRRGETAVVKCNYTGETYFLTCLETRWKGELSRCSAVLPTKSSQTIESVRHTNQNHGILVVIGIGVALGVALGVFILFALVVCHRRRSDDVRRNNERPYADSLLEADERKTIVYTPASTTRTYPCPPYRCMHHNQYTMDCQCHAQLPRVPLSEKSPLQYHHHGVEALLVNCSPTYDHTGHSYQQYQMTSLSPARTAHAREEPEQTTFLTFKMADSTKGPAAIPVPVGLPVVSPGTGSDDEIPPPPSPDNQSSTFDAALDLIKNSMSSSCGQLQTFDSPQNDFSAILETSSS